MKATRKLIPAIALLLVSAVLLSTASYAWFTTNKTVNADMTVGVTAPMNLQINNTAPAAWSNKITFGTYEGLTPCSSVDGVNFVTALGLALAADGIFETDDAVAEVAANLSVVDDNEGYYVLEEFQLRASQTVEANKLSLEVTIDEAEKEDYSPAIRVMVFMKQSDDSWLPIYASTGSHKAVVDKGSGAFGLSAEAYAAKNTVSTITLDAATIYDFKAVVWIEGNDPACVSANVSATPNVAIDIEFKVAD